MIADEPRTNQSSWVQYGVAPTFALVMVSGVIGTTDLERDLSAYDYAQQATDSGIQWVDEPELAVREVETTRRAVSELRRLSGLTWGQLGELLGVSRRSVHHWASGKALNAQNEQRLMRVLDVIRYAYRGSAGETRLALSSPSDEETPFELLVAQRFEDARGRLGRGVESRSRTRPRLSPDARDARKPPAPEALANSVDEVAHAPSRRVRAARTVKVKRGQS